MGRGVLGDKERAWEEEVCRKGRVCEKGRKTFLTSETTLSWWSLKIL